ITSAHFGIGFKSTAGKHHRLGPQLHVFTAAASAHALHAAAAMNEAKGGGVVEHWDARLVDRCMQPFDELRTATEQVTGKPTPELELAVNLERLPPKRRLEADALLLEPLCRGIAVGDEHLGQIRITAILSQPVHVIVVLLGRIGAKIDLCEVEITHIGGKRDQIIDTPEREAERAACECRIAATRFFRRGLQHGHAGAEFASLQGGVGGRIAGADYQYIDVAEVGCCHSRAPPLLLVPKPYSRLTISATAVLAIPRLRRIRGQGQAIASMMPRTPAVASPDFDAHVRSRSNLASPALAALSSKLSAVGPGTSASNSGNPP